MIRCNMFVLIVSDNVTRPKVVFETGEVNYMKRIFVHHLYRRVLSGF